MKLTLTICLNVIVILWLPALHAVEPRTAHTFQLSEGEAAPSATLDDAHWLIGNWQGTAFGSQFEEVWNAPSAGSMVGMFKLFGDDGVNFYELMLITVENGTLSFKVKHFNADFSAWEDKAEFVEFPLVQHSADALHFMGLSFYRRDDNHLDAWVVMRNGENISEHLLSYTRAK